uniref:Uncharacterized protein n=1 Tax=Grammatophora oceanica TaxID=210454 RepID=A0A6U5PFV4_9STRA|mmetsp:Transcript_50782/g.75922  ORF Transcript_50782/g.75922 Transcript_50782/m.75922 type:complete len:144 (+) Transcript_50782:496-927(+)
MFLTRAIGSLYLMQHAQPPLVPASLPQVFDGQEGSAMVLTTVGRPITDTNVFFDRVLNALVELHMGRGQINWIDFHSARFSEQSVVRFRQDMILLVESCFISSAGSQLPIPPQVQTVADAYDPAPESSATVTALVNAIRGSLP